MIGLKKHKRLTEEEVIDIILKHNTQTQENNLHSFIRGMNEYIFYAFDRMYDGFLSTKLITRQEFGFTDNKKPGDYDILLIPYVRDFIHYEMTIAIEVKILRPTRSNPERNSNSMGGKQVWGIYEDGFPYIGLLHLTMTEPLKKIEQQPIKTIPKDAKGPLEEIAINDTYDHFSFYSAEKQTKRLLNHNIPDCVGINCVGLDFYENKGFAFCISLEKENRKSAKMNPMVKRKTIEMIQAHFEKYTSKYIKLKVR